MLCLCLLLLMNTQWVFSVYCQQLIIIIIIIITDDSELEKSLFYFNENVTNYHFRWMFVCFSAALWRRGDIQRQNAAV